MNFQAIQEQLTPALGPSKTRGMQAWLTSLADHSAAAAAKLWFIYGAILLVVTSSRRPAETLFDLRVARNLRAGSRPDEAEAAAAAGLSKDGQSHNGCSFRCFHCGVEVVDAGASVEAAHATASPDCSVGRLDVVMAADGGSAETDRLVSANADRSRRALQRLSREFSNLSRVIAMAESFGFSRDRLVFAATRHFMLNGGQLPDKPGGFIDCLHDCERQFGDSADVIGLFSVDSLLRLVAPLTEAAPAAPAAPSTSAASAAPRVVTASCAASASGSDTVADSGTDRCVLCSQRCRDRVLLPCAHFCTCSQCLRSRSRCPICSFDILATVKAFIT